MGKEDNVIVVIATFPSDHSIERFEDKRESDSEEKLPKEDRISLAQDLSHSKY